MKTFMLPDLGEGLAESEIVKWHVDVGEVVKLDQIVLTVETAKAVVEVPAPFGGKIISRLGNEGDVIEIGSLLLEIDESHSENSNRALTSKGANETKTSQTDAATVVGNVSHHAHSVEVDDFWIGSTHNITPDNLISAMPSARKLAQKLGLIFIRSLAVAKMA